MCYNKHMTKHTTVRDLYGKEFLADTDKLKLSVHVYGIAKQDGKLLISPQFDGFDLLEKIKG